MSGRCRFCGCTHFNPCPAGCGWANREQTVCTECVDVDRAWRLLVVAHSPNMVRAFFRGFTCATNDERATEQPDSPNPYLSGRTAKYFDEGFLAGMRHKRELAKESPRRAATALNVRIDRRRTAR